MLQANGEPLIDSPSTKILILCLPTSVGMKLTLYLPSMGSIVIGKAMPDGGVTIMSQFVDGVCGSTVKDIIRFTALIFKL